MNKKTKLIAKGIVIVLVVAAVVVIAGSYLRTIDIPVLEPKGTIALQEFHLILFAAILSLVVVIPVYVLLITFAIKYREGNEQADYAPTLDRNNKIEVVWWGVPTLLIVILSVVTWTSSQSLDPYKPLAPADKTMTIQVVALDWKWLFIYPQEHIASVNELVIPNNTAVKFLITANAPMNSFWIPQLSGQIYAMPGMQTQLNVRATSVGTFSGLSANISGTGFSGMVFKTKSVSMASFNEWVRSAQGATRTLNNQTYTQLSRPTMNVPVSYYTDNDSSLFDNIIMRYMMPMTTATTAISTGHQHGSSHTTTLSKRANDHSTQSVKGLPGMANMQNMPGMSSSSNATAGSK